jgi:hypothetical protein
MGAVRAKTLIDGKEFTELLIRSAHLHPRVRSLDLRMWDNVREPVYEAAREIDRLQAKGDVAAARFPSTVEKREIDAAIDKLDQMRVLGFVRGGWANFNSDRESDSRFKLRECTEEERALLRHLAQLLPTSGRCHE